MTETFRSEIDVNSDDKVIYESISFIQFTVFMNHF